MSRATDIRVMGARLYFLPVVTRMPLKFGAESLTTVTCARVCIRVEDRLGRSALGWGETPLSVQWVWPSSSSYQARLESLQGFTKSLADEWVKFHEYGHPLEIGKRFQDDALKKAAAQVEALEDGERLPLLAALVCCSPYDLALYDAYGKLNERPAMECLGADQMSSDLAEHLDLNPRFAGKYPADYMRSQRCEEMPAWHLVGGLDPLETTDLTGEEPEDGFPVLLRDWIRTDGLRCLKIKLRGNDAAWDFQRLSAVGAIAREEGVDALTADFNCMVTDPAYVLDVLDQLEIDDPQTYKSLLYVEQPFPYDLDAYPIEVHDLSRRLPLYLDESAHDWKYVQRGRQLGWNGVALKTCKTMTGALLSLAWASEHDMGVMVQDLTNPMLAQAPHLLLAAWSPTLRGVETNSMQFYPEASHVEASIHPELYRRRDGNVKISTLVGPGFGYAGAESARELPPPATTAGDCEERNR